MGINFDFLSEVRDVDYQRICSELYYYCCAAEDNVYSDHRHSILSDRIAAELVTKLYGSKMVTQSITQCVGIGSILKDHETNIKNSLYKSYDKAKSPMHPQKVIESLYDINKFANKVHHGEKVENPVSTATRLLEELYGVVTALLFELHLITSVAKFSEVPPPWGGETTVSNNQRTTQVSVPKTASTTESSAKTADYQRPIDEKTAYRQHDAKSAVQKQRVAEETARQQREEDETEWSRRVERVVNKLVEEKKTRMAEPPITNVNYRDYPFSVLAAAGYAQGLFAPSSADTAKILAEKRTTISAKIRQWESFGKIIAMTGIKSGNTAQTFWMLTNQQTVILACIKRNTPNGSGYVNDVWGVGNFGIDVSEKEIKSFPLVSFALEKPTRLILDDSISKIEVGCYSGHYPPTDSVYGTLNWVKKLLLPHGVEWHYEQRHNGYMLSVEKKSIPDSLRKTILG